MSTSGISPQEENAQEIAFLKEQVVEMICIMQQLVVGGGHNSSGHSLRGPQTEYEISPHQDMIRTKIYHPRAMTKK